MKTKALTRGITLLLALAMLLAFAFSATAYAPFKGGDKWGWGCHHGHHHHHCGPRYKAPVNDTGYLIVRILVSDAADVGKAFKFNYTIDGAAQKSEVLAAALTADKATIFKMTYKVGTKFDVSQLAAAGFVTTSTGATGTIKPGNNVVEFVNARPAADPGDVPAMG